MVHKHSNEAFDDFWKFIVEYKLASIETNTSLKSAIKPLHSKAFPLLIWRQEFETTPIWPTKIKKTLSFNAYYNEVLSDLSTSLFLYSQGMYKPACLTLRSSIENFLKALGIANDKKKVLKIKSVFELFKDVRKMQPMKGSPEALTAYNLLHTCYGDLCNFAHTASEKHMDSLQALKILPQYIGLKSAEFSKHYESVCRCLLILIMIYMSDQFHKNMHYSHKDVMLKALPTQIKKQLMQST